MKKIFKITGLILASLLLILILLPFVFQGKITGIVLDQANKNLHAKVTLSGVSLSLIKNFPNATATLHDVSVTGTGAFEGDTLFYAKNTSATINLMSLIGGKEITVKGITLKSPRILAKVLEDESANWDIIPEGKASEEPDTETSSVSLSLEFIEISDAWITYEDRETGMSAQIDNWNGTFTGKISGETALFTTKSEISALSFLMGRIPFLNKASLYAEGSVEADLGSGKYTFQNNLIRVNALETSLNGWIQMPDTSKIDVDLALETGKVTFKDVLSLIPAIYLSDFSAMETAGNLTLKASAKGTLQGENYPAFDILLAVDNGMFKYPSLPKSVGDIFVNAQITGKGGPMDSARIDISRFHFAMGGNPFDMTARITSPVSDPDVKASLKGKLDLGMVKEVYPLSDSIVLQGQLEADISASGRLSYLEKEQYDQFQAQGTLTVQNISYQSKDLPEITIQEAGMSFSPKEMVLNAFSMMIGKNDLQASGKTNNPLPFFLKNGLLKGTLRISSSYLNLNDFMSAEEETATADSVPMLAFEIPEKLDLDLSAQAKEVIFYQLTMKNIQGNLRVKNGRVSLENVTANAMGGSVAFNGFYEAPDRNKPRVEMSLDMQKVSFAETFNTMNIARSLAPIFEKVKGNYSMQLQLNTSLTGNLDPIFSSLTGKGLLQSNDVEVSGVTTLNVLAKTLNNEAMKNITTKDLKILFDISNGRVNTSSFPVNIGDTRLDLSGSTGLDQTIDYNIKVNLPARLAKAGVTSLQGTIGGTFTDPKISLDAGNLIKQAASGAIDKLFGRNSDPSGESVAASETQSTSTLQPEEIRAAAKAAGDKLIEEAKKQGDEMIAKANNSLLKAAARVAAAQLTKSAEEKAARLNAEAEAKIKAMEAEKQ